MKMRVDKNTAVLDLTQPSERNPRGYESRVVTPPTKSSPPQPLPPPQKEQSPPKQQQPRQQKQQPKIAMQTPPKAEPTTKQQQMQLPSPIAKNDTFDEDDRSLSSVVSYDESMAGFSLVSDGGTPARVVQQLSLLTSAPPQQLSLTSAPPPSLNQNKWLVQMPTTADDNSMYISDSETTRGSDTAQIMTTPLPEPGSPQDKDESLNLYVGDTKYAFADDDSQVESSLYVADDDYGLSSDPMGGIQSSTDMDSDADVEIYTTTTLGTSLNISGTSGFIPPLQVRDVT